MYSVHRSGLQHALILMHLTMYTTFCGTHELFPKHHLPEDKLKPTGRTCLQFLGKRRVADTLTFMELMAPEYSETILHRQPVSVLRTTAQHASVGNGGLSPWTAGKHTDKEVTELEHALGASAAATLQKCPSATRIITDTSATSAWTVEDIFALAVFSIVALLKLC